MYIISFKNKVILHLLCRCFIFTDKNGIIFTAMNNLCCNYDNCFFIEMFGSKSIKEQ